MTKNKLKILILLIPVIISAQIQRNLYSEKIFLQRKFDQDDTYIRNVGDKLTKELFQDTTNFIKLGFQGGVFFQNNSIYPEWNYNDKLNYCVVPYLYGRGTKNLTFYVSFMSQDAKTDIVDSRKSYLGESQVGHWGDFEIAKIQYEIEHFYVKFGRDYFMPGMYYYESMLF